MSSTQTAKKYKPDNGSNSKQNESPINLTFGGLRTNTGYSMLVAVNESTNSDRNLDHIRINFSIIGDVSGSMGASISGSQHMPTLMRSVSTAPDRVTSLRQPTAQMPHVSQTHYDTGNNSRIDVVIGSIRRILKLFGKYADRGAQIHVSLGVFSDNCEIFLDNVRVDDQFLEKYLKHITKDDWFRLRGGTNFVAALDANDIFNKKFNDNPSNATRISVMASDGFHTDTQTASRDSLLGTAHFTDTVCVGNNVDEELMQNIGRNTHYGSDERTIQDCIEGCTFQRIAEIAKNLSFKFMTIHDCTILIFLVKSCLSYPLMTSSHHE